MATEAKQDLASAISRDDACRVVAEAFVLEPATKKRFVVSNGGEMSALYLRSLREQGFSRRAELGKLIQGDMAAFSELDAARFRLYESMDAVLEIEAFFSRSLKLS